MAPSMLSPRAKTHNYLNMIMAEKPVKALKEDAWAIQREIPLVEAAAPSLRDCFLNQGGRRCLDCIKAVPLRQRACGGAGGRNSKVVRCAGWSLRALVW